MEWSAPLAFETRFDPTVSPQDNIENGADEVPDDHAAESAPEE
jgi:hypothetical protein